MKFSTKKQAVVAAILLTLATSSVSAAETKSEPSFTSWFKNIFVMRSGSVTGPKGS